MAVSNPSKCKPNPESACDDSIDLAGIEAALQTVAKNSGTTRPKGFTVAEYSAKKGIAVRTGRDNLSTLYNNGLVDRTIWRNDGHLLYVYRMKNGAKR